MLTTIENLLYLPRFSLRWHCTPFAGQGTKLLLPDGESTGIVTTTTDERWKSWHSATIEVGMLIEGPAAMLNPRELMDLFRHHMGGGAWRMAPNGAAQTSLRADAELPMLEAVPHTCASLPGEPCGVRNGGRGGACTADRDAQPVTVAQLANA
jgi:hypothetical protein